MCRCRRGSAEFSGRDGVRIFGSQHSDLPPAQEDSATDDGMGSTMGVTQRAAGSQQDMPPSWRPRTIPRSEEHTSELQSLMRISYAVFCLQKKHTTYELYIL